MREQSAKRRSRSVSVDAMRPFARGTCHNSVPEHGLAFDLLSSTAAPVTTGHDIGLITW